MQRWRTRSCAEAELAEERRSFIEGCPAPWQELPIPEGRIVVGLDGGREQTRFALHPRRRTVFRAHRHSGIPVAIASFA